VVVTAALLVFACAAPAVAGGTDPVNCAQNPTDPRCDVHAGQPGGPGDGGGGGGGGSGGGSQVCHYPITNEVVPCYLPNYGQFADDGCYYKPATGNDLAAAEALGGTPTPPGRWYIGTCGYPPSPVLTKFRIFGGNVLPNPADLAADAVNQLHLPLPAIRVNPAPPAAQLVFLPTWMWLDGSSWGSRSATASVPGLSVTATAKPAKLLFSTGDGSSVSCPGPGTAWTTDKDPNAASPDCGHTYQKPGSFTVTATVTWQISWAGGGQTGTVPDLTTTSTLTINVTDSQALNTKPQG
jgi:hypothetical protein